MSVYRVTLTSTVTYNENDNGNWNVYVSNFERIFNVHRARFDLQPLPRTINASYSERGCEASMELFLLFFQTVCSDTLIVPFLLCSTMTVAQSTIINKIFLFRFKIRFDSVNYILIQSIS
jgi:hypothetical protein